MVTRLAAVIHEDINIYGKRLLYDMAYVPNPDIVTLYNDHDVGTFYFDAWRRVIICTFQTNLSYSVPPNSVHNFRILDTDMNTFSCNRKLFLVTNMGILKLFISLDKPLLYGNTYYLRHTPNANSDSNIKYDIGLLWTPEAIPGPNLRIGQQSLPNFTAAINLELRTADNINIVRQNPFRSLLQVGDVLKNYNIASNQPKKYLVKVDIGYQLKKNRKFKTVKIFIRSKENLPSSAATSICIDMVCFMENVDEPFILGHVANDNVVLPPPRQNPTSMHKIIVLQHERKKQLHGHLKLNILKLESFDFLHLTTREGKPCYGIILKQKGRKIYQDNKKYVLENLYRAPSPGLRLYEDNTLIVLLDIYVVGDNKPDYVMEIHSIKERYVLKLQHGNNNTTPQKRRATDNKNYGNTMSSLSLNRQKQRADDNNNYDNNNINKMRTSSNRQNQRNKR